MKTTNKNYQDVLYWISSSITKDKPYHISSARSMILRKLMHYANSDEKITYSNDAIAAHTFMGVQVIRKAIPQLAELGFITSTLVTTKDEYGKPKTRRTITINYSMMDTILIESDAYNPNDVVSTETPVEIPAEPVEEVTPTVEEDNCLADLNQADEDNKFNPMDVIKPVYNGKSDKVLEYLKSQSMSYLDLNDPMDFKSAWNRLNKTSFKNVIGEYKLSTVINDIT